MDELPKVKIALCYDEWAHVAQVLADAGSRENDGFLLSLAAVLERSIGHPAVAGALEAAAERVLANRTQRIALSVAQTQGIIVPTEKAAR